MSRTAFACFDGRRAVVLAFEPDGRVAVHHSADSVASALSSGASATGTFSREGPRMIMEIHAGAASPVAGGSYLVYFDEQDACVRIFGAPPEADTTLALLRAIDPRNPPQDLATLANPLPTEERCLLPGGTFTRRSAPEGLAKPPGRERWSDTAIGFYPDGVVLGECATTDSTGRSSILHRRGTYRVARFNLEVEWGAPASSAEGSTPAYAWARIPQTGANVLLEGCRTSLLESWPTAVLEADDPDSKPTDVSPLRNGRRIRMPMVLTYDGEHRDGSIVLWRTDHEPLSRVRFAEQCRVLQSADDEDTAEESKDVWGAIEFDEEGTARAYEGPDDAFAAPLLVGRHWTDQGTTYFELKRRPGAEEQSLLYAEGRYAAQPYQGVLYLLHAPGRASEIRELPTHDCAGKPFLLEVGERPGTALPPPPPPPPPISVKRADDSSDEQELATGKSPAVELLEISVAVSKQKWALTWALASVCMGGFWIFTSIPGVTPFAGWASLALFVLYLIVQPNDAKLGDSGDTVLKLALDDLGAVVGRVFMFALAWGVIIYGLDIAGWAKDKASDAYEAGKDAVTGLVESDGNQADALVAETDGKIRALANPGVTRDRLELETRLAEDLAKLDESPEGRQRAIDAYGRAATTASSGGALAALEKLIDEQVALDRKGGTK